MTNFTQNEAEIRDFKINLLVINGSKAKSKKLNLKSSELNWISEENKMMYKESDKKIAIEMRLSPNVELR